jgi:hypothetical protein
VRVRARWSTAGEGRAELIGESHGAARGRASTRGNGSATGKMGPQSRERRGARERRNRRRQLGPTGQRARERQESAREGVAADRWIPPVRRRRRAGARPGWAELGRLGCFAFFFFPGFSNCFSISFSLGFQFKFNFKFQIQTNSNMCNNSKNI